jgi:hypothetical protein
MSSCLTGRTTDIFTKSSSTPMPSAAQTTRPQRRPYVENRNSATYQSMDRTFLGILIVPSVCSAVAIALALAFTAAFSASSFAIPN